MEAFIGLIIIIVIFAAVAWGGFWVCDKAGFPDPARWVWGAVLLICLLYFLVGRFGGTVYLH